MAIRNIAVINVLKSDYFRIEISPVLPASRYHGLLKSDYFRIEIRPLRAPTRPTL